MYHICEWISILFTFQDHSLNSVPIIAIIFHSFNNFDDGLNILTILFNVLSFNFINILLFLQLFYSWLLIFFDLFILFPGNLFKLFFLLMLVFFILWIILTHWGIKCVKFKRCMCLLIFYIFIRAVLKVLLILFICNLFLSIKKPHVLWF